jgi:glycerol uptake facilitator-like aquaporin
MSANLLTALWRSAGVTLRALWRVTRQIFHEAMGAIFAIFAGYGVLLAWRQWHQRPVWWLLMFAIGYAAMMAAFAFLSFRSARRVR